METVSAYLALGANLGDREGQLRAARDVLAAAPGVRLMAASPLYETVPVGGPPGQPLYLNAVLQVVTSLSSRDLLNFCQAVEYRFGRRRLESWGPRTLDIDLLFYGQETVVEPGLVVPHSRLHLRRFVLVPLADLAPSLRHPAIGRSISELLAALDNGEAVRLYSREW